LVISGTVPSWRQKCRTVCFFTNLSKLTFRLGILCLLPGVPLNIMVKWLTLLLHIREAPGSNLSLGNGYPEGFHVFPQYIQANARIVP
jgi:hypothetical protein